MTALDAAVQIRSLRVQLDVLEARLRTQQQQPDRHTLADLRGMLQGQSDTSSDEIDAAKYRGRLEEQP